MNAEELSIESIQDTLLDANECLKNDDLEQAQTFIQRAAREAGELKRSRGER
jgi:hypothetical protein